eukprot:4864505-Ditylum_brightwellii.AAC.1
MSSTNAVIISTSDFPAPRLYNALFKAMCLLMYSKPSTVLSLSFKSLKESLMVLIKKNIPLVILQKLGNLDGESSISAANSDVNKANEMLMPL